jgi:three-Cys-motif partner protein
MATEYDEIGVWSEVKLDIVKKYAAAYTTIMESQRARIPRLSWIYVDAYAGPGYHLSRQSGELVEGSPLIALNTNPAFHEYHFIDADAARARQLRELAGTRSDVFIYSDDCNMVLRQQIFPRAQFRDYKRALCLLDPYNIDLEWAVIEAAGRSGSIELFVNLMIMDINRNAMRKDPDKSLVSKMGQLTRLWGDESWRAAGYDNEPDLFEQMRSYKVSNEKFAEAFRRRLQEKAGFKHVPSPMPMKNRTGAVIYYLYFASPNPTGMKVVTDIFNDYRTKQGI